MDVLVIGNGFDLAHGLKTSYKDFLEACHKISLQEAVDGKADYKKLCDTNLWMKHFITRQKQLGDTWIDLENEIFEVIRMLSNRYKQNALSRKVLVVDKNNTDFNLLDIEKCLREPYWDEHLNKEGCEEPFKSYIINYYIETFQDVIPLLYKQLRKFTQEFEKYLMYDVLTQITPAIKYNFPLQSPNRAVHVLSFNYTDTYERLYKTKNMYSDPKSVYVYVHGKAGESDDCNLVLGTHSFDNTTIPVDFNVFKKHNQRHRYGTIEAYQNFLNILTDPKRIIKPVFHVIGHSLDRTDHKILKHVFQANKNAVINVYWHDVEAQERMINNITEIITEEEVMTRVRFINQRDEKRGILIPATTLVQSAS